MNSNDADASLVTLRNLGMPSVAKLPLQPLGFKVLCWYAGAWLVFTTVADVTAHVVGCTMIASNPAVRA